MLQQRVLSETSRQTEFILDRSLVYAVCTIQLAAIGAFADNESERPAGIMGPLDRDATLEKRFPQPKQSKQSLHTGLAHARSLVASALEAARALKEIASRGFASCWLR